MVCAVTTDVKRKEISLTKMIRNRVVRKDATNKIPIKITDEPQEFIIDNIKRRERLECNPSRA